jgi:protein-disulfide isomerase
MNKGTAIIAVLLAFLGGYFVGRETGKGGSSTDTAGASLVAGGSLEEQEKALGPGNPQSDRSRMVLGGNDPILGAKDALVTVVEFSDFQCPFCKRGSDVIHKINENYPKDVRVVFKQNPLSFHKDAMPAAQAALAAHEQGKFWAMHDKMFENQAKLDLASIEGYAQQIGLNLPKFKAAMASDKVKKQIDEDVAQANRAGARGTPTFFVNGKVVRGAQPFEQFKIKIDEELSYAKTVMAQKKLAATAVYTEIMREAKPGSAAAPAQPPSAPVGVADPAKTYKVPVGASPFHGNPNAKVTLIEFSEFQCPFCSKVGPTMKELETKYGKDLRVVFKHNPLPFHPNAQPAAEASLAAGEQGKFWEMHDLLFANQQKLDPASLEEYAKELKLDLAKFKAAIASGKFKAQIKADMDLAAQFGARGTPSFFINGRPLRGAQPATEFIKVIDEEKAKAEQLLAKGTPAAKLYDAIIATGLEKVEAGPPPQARGGEPDPSAVYKVELTDEDPVTGPKTAKVTIIEFSDFQCPFCTRVVPTVHELVKKYPKDVRIAFKHLPLPMHPNAPLAAEASLAAHEQGKFWPMHDKLFENQRTLDRASIDKYAGEIGLDVAKFKAALDSGKYKARVQKDAAMASNFGVNGTPAFFINGRFLSGALPLEQFEAKVKDEIGKADALLAKGTKPQDLYAALIKDGKTKVEAGAPAAMPMAKVDAGNSPSKGRPNAPVTIIEFSDFQCPYCSRVVGTVHELVKKYPNDVRVVFKQLPLPMHPNAPIAAEASLAAHEQGKFWEMHDKLFANNQKLDRASIEGFAGEVGLDLAKFKAALDSGKFKAQVEAEKQQAQAANINGTPNFVINGRVLAGALPIEQFSTIIDEEIAKAKKK